MFRFGVGGTNKTKKNTTIIECPAACSRWVMTHWLYLFMAVRLIKRDFSLGGLNTFVRLVDMNSDTYYV